MIFLYWIFGIIAIVFIVYKASNPCMFGHNMVTVPGSESDDVWYNDHYMFGRTYTSCDLNGYGIGYYKKAYVEICLN